LILYFKMQRYFTYTLLITWLLSAGACQNQYIQMAAKGRNIEVADTLNELDSQLVQIYLPYKYILDQDMKRVISISETEMVKDKPESALTNFLGDLMLEEGRAEMHCAGMDVIPDISYFNYGGIRSTIPEGEITVGKIFELMPFENELVFLQLSGKQIQDFLDVVAEKGGESVGGVRFTIAENRARYIEIGGLPLQSHLYYWLVTNDYVADGGDGLYMFTERSDFLNSGKKVRDVIISHLEKKYEKGEVLWAEPDGRIAYE
jgi:2',3'-cyclic-nucleotide 2'-phosphodiesterase (5'-nucleotidase family)